MPVMYSSQIPQYMQKGSHGPHITLLHVLLFGAGFGDGIVMDQDYGETTARQVSKLQGMRLRMIEVKGNFDPETRAAIKEVYGFDFCEACKTVPGVTTFIQPDGTGINWSPRRSEDLHRL